MYGSDIGRQLIGSPLILSLIGPKPWSRSPRRRNNRKRIEKRPRQLETFLSELVTSKSYPSNQVMLGSQGARDCRR